MNIKAVRADEVYKKMLEAPPEKRADIFRYELMGPFRAKWALYNVPLKAAQPGGYDVVMASEMLGFLPPARVDETAAESVAALADDSLWEMCAATIERSLSLFDAERPLPVRDYLFSLLLANPDSPYTKLSDGYSGDGGIPGYIFGALVPSERTIARMPAALAHECDHNVRFQFIEWTPAVNLGDMLVCEGLAENFAVSLFGEKYLGPWVGKLSIDELEGYVKPLMKDELGVTGFDNITAWLYGDELASLRGFFPVGMPWCAGYACGYHLIRHYLQKTGDSIVAATIRPTAEILAACEDFWV